KTDVGNQQSTPHENRQKTQDDQALESYLESTEGVDGVSNENPSEGIDPVSDTNAVDDISQFTDSGALGGVDVATPGCAYPTTALKYLEWEQDTAFGIYLRYGSFGFVFAETARSSLRRRHSTLGPKWFLEPGTVVEDILLQAGLELSVDHPIQSFMVDLQDKYTESLFSQQDWTEIKSNIPASAAYSAEAAKYLDALEDIVQEQDINSVLDRRPLDPETAIWMNNTWSGSRLLAEAVPGSYIITGEITGIDSTSRRNNKERYVNIAPQNNRKKMGVRADMIWRTMEAPVRDWMIGEASRQQDENAGKYVRESTFKVPRQLRPVVQRVSLCWGTQGTNVTRLKWWIPARVYPGLKKLPLSLNAGRQLLLVRADTLRLIDEYNHAEQEERKEKRARAGYHYDNDDDWR
ncbi:hypothetical protein BGW38_005274, partial [Lunasporangiospora selenospora]